MLNLKIVAPINNSVWYVKVNNSEVAKDFANAHVSAITNSNYSLWHVKVNNLEVSKDFANAHVSAMLTLTLPTVIHNVDIMNWV